MGVKLLNTFLRTKCSSSHSIVKMNLNNLRGIKIAVDTSIYMYRFIGDKALLENFYLMCSIFRQYEITPIFIFEGKPPVEKYDELEERKASKKRAEREYKYLKSMLDKEKDTLAKQEIELKMDKMRKKFIHIKNKHIKLIKNLFQNYGMSYVDAPGESDVLCAYFSKAGIVDACLSEDMDMFVYGCPIVIRYFSLLKHNCVVYTMKHIIRELQMTEEEFVTMCIVSGTDYSKKYSKKTSRNIYHYYSAFIKYKNYIHISKLHFEDYDTQSSSQSSSQPPSPPEKCITFIEYLEQYYRINKEHILHIKNMFNVLENESLVQQNELKIYTNIPIKNTDVHLIELKKQLKDDNFVFIDE